MIIEKSCKVIFILESQDNLLQYAIFFTLKVYIYAVIFLLDVGKLSGFEGCPWQRKSVTICSQFLSITCITAKINNNQTVNVNIDVTEQQHFYLRCQLVVTKVLCR